MAPFINALRTGNSSVVGVKTFKKEHPPNNNNNDNNNDNNDNNNNNNDNDNNNNNNNIKTRLFLKANVSIKNLLRSKTSLGQPRIYTSCLQIVYR